MAASSGSTVARLRFEFLGDLKGYRESLATAKTEGNTAVKSLGQAFRDAFGKMPASGYLGGLKQDLELGRSKTLILKDAASALKKELGSLSVSALHTGLNGIKNVLGTLKSAAGSVFQGILMGVGIAAFQDLTRIISDVVHIIPDLITKGQAYALTIHDIMVATGGTAEATSRMVATMGFLGESAGSMSTIFSQLARNLPDAEKGLNRLGITTRGANGEFLDAVTIIDNVRSTLSGTADGFAKMTQVIELFGGRGALGKLAEYFTLTDSKMAILVKHFTGQLLTTDQIHLADNMKREWDNIQGVLTGVGVTLMTIVGPQIIAFFGTVAQVIQDNAKAIETAVGQALQFIFGLLQGLAGLSGSTQTLTSSLGLVETVTDPYAISLNNAQTALEELDAKQAALPKSTKAATSALSAETRALDAQSKATDKQISALADLDKAQEKTYQLRLKSIKSILDEKLATLDAAEAARSLAIQQHDLNESLNQAQIDLAKAQAGEKDTKTGAMVVNAEDVSKAMQAIADVQGQQAELVHQTAVNQQKAAITSVKDYVDAIDQLVSDSTDKAATLKDLKAREGALTAGGKPAAGTDAALELQAVLAAEQRVREQASNTAKTTALTAIKDELAAKKAAIAEARAALGNAETASQAAYKKTRAELVANLAKIQAQQKAWEDQQFAVETFGKVFGSVFGDPKGEVQGGFESARLAGIKFADDFKAALVGKDGKGGILGALTSIGGAIGSLATALGTIPEIPAGGRLALGAAIAAFGASHGNLFLVTSGLAIAGMAAGDVGKAYTADLPGVQQSHAEQDRYMAYMQKQLAAGKPVLPYSEWAKGERSGSSGGGTWATPTASGGLVGGRGSEVRRLGENGAEWVVNAPALRALASLNRNPAQALAAVAGGGGMGGSPAVIRIEIGGKPLTDYVDEHLSWRRSV